MAERPVWNDVKDLLALYGTLYRAMNAIIDLTDYAAVSSNASGIKDRLLRQMSDPSLMPITRELSVAKMQTIVTWIDHGTPIRR